MRKFAYILINRPGKPVAQMDVLLEAELNAFNPNIAKLHGFEIIRDKWIRPDTDETILDELRRSGFEGLPWSRVTQEQHADFHADRTFRNARKLDLTVDMPKAREIHKDKLRRDRSPLMAALDIEAIRADEDGDKAKRAAVIARKQALRDVTARPEIEAAKTPAELKAITV